MGCLVRFITVKLVQQVVHVTPTEQYNDDYRIRQMRPAGGLPDGEVRSAWPAVSLYVPTLVFVTFCGHELLKERTPSNGFPPPYFVFNLWDPYFDCIECRHGYEAMLVQKDAIAQQKEAEPRLVSTPAPEPELEDIDIKRVAYTDRSGRTRLVKQAVILGINGDRYIETTVKQIRKPEDE